MFRDGLVAMKFHKTPEEFRNCSAIDRAEMVAIYQSHNKMQAYEEKQREIKQKANK